MKLSFILSLLLATTVTSYCQEKIIEANLSFTLPNANWTLLKKQDVIRFCCFQEWRGFGFYNWGN